MLAAGMVAVDDGFVVFGRDARSDVFVDRLVCYAHVLLVRLAFKEPCGGSFCDDVRG